MAKNPHFLRRAARATPDTPDNLRSLPLLSWRRSSADQSRSITSANRKRDFTAGRIPRSAVTDGSTSGRLSLKPLLSRWSVSYGIPFSSAKRR